MFIQSRIVIADLNLLERGLDTISSTPMTIPVEGKTPSDVHHTAMTIAFLVKQIAGLQKIAGKQLAYWAR